MLWLGNFECGRRADRGCFDLEYHHAGHRRLTDFSAFGIADARAGERTGWGDSASQYFEHRVVQRLFAIVFDDYRDSESQDRGCEAEQHPGPTSGRRHETAGGRAIRREGKRVSGAHDVRYHASARYSDTACGRD